MSCVPRFLALFFLLTVSAFSQVTDITGWSDLRWGTNKPAALKTLVPLGAHECNRTRVSCAEAAGAEVLLLENYNFVKVRFTVNLFFTAKNGLSKAIMTAEDKRDAFEKVLSELTARYGRPGFQSEYDGDDEGTHTTWIWSKARGKVSLDSEETSGVFTITYESRR